MAGYIIPRGTLPSFGAVGFIIVFLFLLAAIIYSWTRYAFNIKIDTDEKTIYFKNIITRQITFYSFNDFDCYLDTYANSGRGNSYKVVYLIKNRKAEKIITGFYYTNIDELQDAVSSIKYKGFQPNFSTLTRKSFLNKDIID